MTIMSKISVIKKAAVDISFCTDSKVVYCRESSNMTAENSFVTVEIGRRHAPNHGDAKREARYQDAAIDIFCSIPL